MVPVVASIAVVVSPALGGVPAEEELVDPKGKQEKHQDHQEASRIIIRRVGALVVRLLVMVVVVVVVLLSKEAAEETRGGITQT